jgi:hypothetical protein
MSKSPLTFLSYLACLSIGTAFGSYIESQENTLCKDQELMLAKAAELGVRQFLNEFSINHNRRKEARK